MTYIGLTWDHPRGYNALAETARCVNADRAAPLITWGRQPLGGFESAPITDLTARYDLAVLDHPHIGEEVAERSLIPLEDLFSAEQLASAIAPLALCSKRPSVSQPDWYKRSSNICSGALKSTRFVKRCLSLQIFLQTA